VVSTIARDTRAVLVGEVEGRAGVTPYAGWVARFGLWPFWLLALASSGWRCVATACENSNSPPGRRVTVAGSNPRKINFLRTTPCVFSNPRA